MLLAAGALESYTLSVAWNEIRSEAKKLGFTPWDYLTKGPDPLNPAVFLEDSVAVVGVGIAAACIGMTHVSGDPMYDALGSIAVGGMLGAVAVFIINRNRQLLGQTVPSRTEQARSARDRPELHRKCARYSTHRTYFGSFRLIPTQVIRMLQTDEMVLSVQDVKSVMVGPQVSLGRSYWPTTGLGAAESHGRHEIPVGAAVAGGAIQGGDSLQSGAALGEIPRGAR